MSYIRKVFTKCVLNLIFGLKHSETKPEQKHEKLPWRWEFPILFDDIELLQLGTAWCALLLCVSIGLLNKEK